MTNVIELAKQAGCEIRNGHAYNPHTGSLDQILKRFAKLVGNAKLEEAAQVCESRQTPGTGSVAVLTGAADAILNLKEPT